MSTVEPEVSNSERKSEWDAYSDFKLVSRWVTASIRDAIEAYALLDQAGQAGYKITAQERAQLRADILAAAMRLQIELESERESKQAYDDILQRWEGEDGFIERFRTSDFYTGSPEWLGQFASDIRRAGWELGYLKAGREEEKNRGGDPYDGEVREMIEGMTL